MKHIKINFTDNINLYGMNTSIIKMLKENYKFTK